MTDFLPIFLIGICVTINLLAVFVIARPAITNTRRAYWRRLLRRTEEDTDDIFALFFEIDEGCFEQTAGRAKRRSKGALSFLRERYGKGRAAKAGRGRFVAIKRFEGQEDKHRQQLAEIEHCEKFLAQNLAVKAKIATASSGIVKAKDVEELAELARFTLDVAKERDLDFLICGDEIALEKRDIDELTSDIGSSLEKDEFRPFFLPIISSDSLKLAGCSVIAIWNKDSYREIKPEKYMGIASEKGLVTLIEKRILEKGLACLKEWINNGLVSTEFFLEVSLSEKTLRRLDSKKLIHRLELLGLSLKNIRISTSGTLQKSLSDKYKGLEPAYDFRADGALTDIPPFFKKINISGIESGAQRLTEGLAQAGKSVLAKGIDDKERFELAREMRIPLLCGRYFTKELKRENFELFLNKYREGIPLP